MPCAERPTYAIRLVSPSDDDTIHVKQVLPVDGKKLAIGKSYRLSFWVKVCDVPSWRPIVVTHDLPAILHNAFRSPDGDTAVIMINISGKTQLSRFFKLRVRVMWFAQKVEKRYANHISTNRKRRVYSILLAAEFG